MSDLSATTVLLIGLIVVVIAVHVLSLKSGGRWILFDPLNTFWVGILICYVLQPLTHGNTFLSWHTEWEVQKTTLACLLGVLCVILGYGVPTGTGLAAKLPQLPAKLVPGKLLFSGIVLLALGLAGYAYVIRISGGWDNWISVARGGTDYGLAKGYIPELVQGVPAGIFILFLRNQLFRVSLAEKIIGWIGATVLVWWFFYLGSRSRLIIAVLLLLSGYYLPRRRTPGLALVGILFCAIFVLTNIQQNFRDKFTNLQFNLTSIDSKELWGTTLPVFLGGDSEMQRAAVSSGIEFNCAMSVVSLVPETVPYNYGYGFLEVFTRPIPRSLWAGKRYPHMESVQGVLREANLTQASVPRPDGEDLLMGPAFTFVGHWYYVGGFIGMAIGGMITGVLFRAIRSILERGKTNHSVLLVYPFLLSIGFGEAASTPWYWLYSLPFVLLPFILVCHFAAERGAPAKAQPGSSSAEATNFIGSQSIRR